MKATPYSSIARIAKLYDGFLRLTGYEKEISYFIDQLPFTKETSFSVLDTACGTGLYSLAVLKKYPYARITAFDINEKLVERLRYKLQEGELDNRARLFTADILEPLQKISDEKFDLIITAGILEHVPIEKTVISLSRFLALGGYFLNSPAKDNFLGKFIDWLYGCKPYSRKRNMEAFTNNGLVLKKLLVPKSFKELHIFQKEREV